MSVKNYHAFIRAARKHGGLSLPAARKVAKKVAARLDRPVKGVDVQKHPRIFRESLPKRKGGLNAKSKSVRKPVPAKRAAPKRPAVAGRPVVTKRPSPAAPQPQRPIEYVSTPEYRKGGGGGRLQLQIHIMGPSGMKKRELDKIAEGWLTNGKTPAGIEVKALGWNGKTPTTDGRGMRVARSNFRAIPFTF